MTKTDYEQAIKQTGKFILISDDAINGNVNEVLQVFDTEKEAIEYSSGSMKRTKNNRIDLFITTGNPVKVIDGYTYRNDIEPVRELHVGLNW
jgi:predicted HAD superfamily hydrolase